MKSVLHTLEAFDRRLSGAGMRFEGTVIGGAALNLLGVVSRATRDCDVLVPVPLPDEVASQARQFAVSERARGGYLADDWLNTGPASLADQLPSGWEDRRQLVFEGASLRLCTLGRSDLLRSKLFAYCDRGQDLADCLALAPTDIELREIEPWVAKQDANPNWPDHVSQSFAELGRRLKLQRGSDRGL